MKKSFERAIDNVVSFGDTDIFPFPLENLSLRERRADAIKILEDIHKDIDAYISNNPPYFYDSFVPNGHSGFRWATQIDTFWNLYFLALTIHLGPKIEAARIPTSSNKIHSYRFIDGADAQLWDTAFGWRSFYESAQELSNNHKYIVVCDLSEFYRRIYHHRLENALKHISDDDTPSRIMKFLTAFSRGTSYGLPIGGPAARLLSELVLNQIDHLLSAEGFKFCRFADDYAIAADDINGAYNALTFISEKLQLNQGLALQRSKTRILTSSEFRASQPLALDDEDVSDDTIVAAKKNLFQLSVYYDPYSTTASSDYDTLKTALNQLDIMGILNHEIRKSRIHVPTINRITAALRHVHVSISDEAILTIMTNLELFYPCISSILILTNSLFESLSQKTKKVVSEVIVQNIRDGSYVLNTEAARAFAVRILSKAETEEADAIIAQMASHEGPIVRREALAALTKRQLWMVISDLRHRFNTMSPGERRMMIIASYVLRDEGQHWRRSATKSFDEFEKFVLGWIQAKPNGIQDLL